MLADGEPVPNREKLTGADALVAFFMAEALGSRFYGDPNAPIDQRVLQVFSFLHERGIKPSTHDKCGAAGGFIGIVQNAIQLAQNQSYIERQRLLLPLDVYEEKLADDVRETYKRRLAVDAYKDYDAALITEAVQKISGPHAIAGLRDDGRGVHGHVEEAIVRITIPGVSCSVNNLAEATSGREVFAINDTRRTMLAHQFGRGNDTDYRIAEIAGEDFIDAGHGTLASNLPTILVAAA